jgi:hypothetical protein
LFYFSKFYLKKKVVIVINARAPRRGRGIESQVIAKATSRYNPEEAKALVAELISLGCS